MLKRILFFVLAFGVALGGATELVVMRAKPAISGAKTSAADSAGMPAERDSSTAADSVAAGASAKPAKDSTPVVRAAEMPPCDSTPAVASKGTPHADSAAPPTRAAPVVPVANRAPQVAPVTAILAGGRLSKIFGAMAARDAAKVLEQMDDADIKEILGRLNDKKAAEILALLPPARVALISKAALAAPGPGK